MADDSVVSSGAVVGVVSTVCTCLLGAAGLNLKHLAAHNSQLVKQLEKRDADVDALNVKLLGQGEEIGTLRSFADEVVRLREQLAEMDAARQKQEDRADALYLEKEKLWLENMSLRNKLEER